ncbi:hypothetical protein TEA_003304 [Camellia sinensis var. sinensis]|uniref:Uncharacterized protein n=1 Tax=Camellia sinensis var. sinensis TaxID=542762 RepID=A0A4S4D8Y1_CAMSN|nr:hypothetical protein TEA_003304 [Camellia sinensis var. sinensis]
MRATLQELSLNLSESSHRIGANEKDFTLVLAVWGKVVSYNVKSKALKEFHHLSTDDLDDWVHEMAMVSATQEAQKDNLRSFNDYMMTVLEILYADGDEEKLIRSSLHVGFDAEIRGLSSTSCRWVFSILLLLEDSTGVLIIGCIQYKTAIPYGLNLAYIVLSFAVYCCYEFAARLLLFYSAEQMLHYFTLLLICYAAPCTVVLL